MTKLTYIRFVGQTIGSIHFNFVFLDGMALKVTVAYPLWVTRGGGGVTVFGFGVWP